MHGNRQPCSNERNPMRVPFSHPIGRKKGRWKTVECRSRDTCRPPSNWNLDFFCVLYVCEWYRKRVVVPENAKRSRANFAFNPKWVPTRDRIKEPFWSFVKMTIQLEVFILEFWFLIYKSLVAHEILQIF